MANQFVTDSDIRDFYNDLKSTQKAKIGLNTAHIRFNPINETIEYRESEADSMDVCKLLPNKEMLANIEKVSELYMVGITNEVMRDKEMINRALNEKRLSMNVENPVLIANIMESQITGKFIGETNDYLLFKSLKSDVPEAMGTKLDNNPKILVPKTVGGFSILDKSPLIKDKIYKVDVKNNILQKVEEVKMSLNNTNTNVLNNKGITR